MPDPAHYLSAWISNSAPRERGSALYWSEPFALQRDADHFGKALIDAGKATLCVVVEVSAEGKRALAHMVRPRSARRIIEHWEAIWEVIDPA